MTWSLHATGHAVEELENELVEKLHEALADPRFGTLAIRFIGDFVTRDLLHTASIQTAPGLPETPVQEQPSAQEAPAEPEPSAPAEQAAASDAKASAPKADTEPAAT